MRVIIISGVPGSGKSTVARMLATRFERAAHIESDLVGERFIVSGMVPPQGPPQDEAAAQLKLRRTNICLLADSFADAGFVRTHLENIYGRLGVSSRTAAVLRAFPCQVLETRSLGQATTVRSEKSECQ